MLIYGTLKPNPSAQGSHLLKIKCPWCPRHHIHGWPRGSGMAAQFRVPHCDSEHGGPANPDYLIAPGFAERRKLGS